MQAVGAGENIGIEFVNVFCYCVRGQRLADVVFDLGQRRMVAVGGTAGGVDEALYFCIAGGNQHVQKAANVGFVGSNRVFKGAGHAAKGGLVKNVVDLPFSTSLYLKG